MKIVRAKKDKDNPFIQISQLMVRDEALSIEAKGFLLILLDLPLTWDFSIAGMAKKLKISPKSVGRLINELKEKGYCKTSQRNKDGKFGTYKYSFSEIPLSQKGKAVEIPLSQKPLSGKPLTGFVRQENIRINKKLIIKKIEVEKGKEKPDFSTAAEVSNLLLSDKSLLDSLAAYYRLEVSKIKEKVLEFVEYKFRHGDTWKSVTDLNKNFDSWLRINIKNEKSIPKQTIDESSISLKNEYNLLT